MTDTKKLFWLLIIFASSVSLFCWVEVARRVHLFYANGAQPYRNHVGDGYFACIYTLLMASAIAFGVSAVVSRRHRRRGGALGVLGVVSGLACAGVFVFLHQSAVLVTYAEFAERFGP